MTTPPGSTSAPRGAAAKRPAWENFVQPGADDTADKAPARVLVVDDNVAVRRTFERMLKAQGHEILSAEDGREALAVLNQHSADAVLLDMEMPAMSGLEVLAVLRQDPRFLELPVVLCSGSDEMEDMVRCIELGADDYLVKPVRPQLLYARLRAAIERKHARDQERAHLDRIDRERRRGDALLASMFPEPVVQEFRDTGTVASRKHDDVAVLFCDVVNFTAWCDRHPPEAVVETLRLLVQCFEELCARNALLKIKTVGDAFMASAGLFETNEDPVVTCVRAAHEMIQGVRDLGVGWEVRVGIHVGPVVSGIVGHTQCQFDIWGDTVNIAARVEAFARPSTIALSATAYDRARAVWTGESLGAVDVKGKGSMELFLVAPAASGTAPQHGSGPPSS